MPAIIYLVILFADIISLVFNLPTLHLLTKPLLMPVLAIYLYGSLKPIALTSWYLPLAGILLAWAGDVFLMFDKTNPIFFLAGLGSFLGTHIFYILFFNQILQPAANWWKNNIWLWGAVILYGICLVWGLWPGLGSMKIPVIIYAACISVMVIFSLRIQPSMDKRIWVLFAIGAFLFFISDSILAINKFLQPFLWASAFIMVTYGLAQYFIVKGTVRYFQAISGEG